MGGSDVISYTSWDEEEEEEEEEAKKTEETETEEEGERKFHMLEACLQDSADVLRWSESGKDATEKRLARDKATGMTQRLAFALALLLPPIAVAALDGAEPGSTMQLAVAWAEATVKHFDSYTRDPLWFGTALALSVERVCCREWGDVEGIGKREAGGGHVCTYEEHTGVCKGDGCSEQLSTSESS